MPAGGLAAYLREQEHKALLRFLTCGSRRRRQVDPDRPPALRHQADLRGPAGGARARHRASTARPATTSTSRCSSTASRPSASRASPSTSPTASSRPPKRTLHRRRHARPRAVHPQHGDRRLDGRPRRPAGRCAQGRADADPAPRLHRLAARHPARRAGGQQDRPRRTSTKSVFDAHRRRLSGASRRSSASRRSVPIPISARFGDNVTDASRPHALVRRPDAARPPRDRRRRRRPRPTRPFRFPVQWVNRPNLDFRGFAGTVASGRIAVGDRVVVAKSGQRDPASSASSPRTATSRRAAAGEAVTLVLEDEIDVSRGDMLARSDAPAGRRRPVRGPPHLDGRRAAAAGPLLHPAHRGATASARRSRRSSTRSTSTPSRTRRRRRLHMNEIGVCNISHAGADRLRPLRRQPHHRRLHPDRPLHQRDGRRRHDRLSAAPRAPTSTGRRSTSTARPRARAQGPEAGRPLVHGPLGLRQVDHRQPGREAPARQGRHTYHARRRQRPPRPQPRPRLHRRRPRREHPPRRRGGQADGRCRADRARVVHLAVPRRARSWRAS